MALRQQYPMVKGLTWTVLKTPEYFTVLKENPAKLEVRVKQSDNPIWHWQLTYDYLYGPEYNSPNNIPSYPPYYDVQVIVGFYNARNGMFDDFLFLDPDDHYVGPGINPDGTPNLAVALQLISGGDGNWYSPLQRDMGGFYEDIYDVFGTLNVYANGVLMTMGMDYVVGGPGAVLPNGAILHGMYLVWGAVFAVWQPNHAYAVGDQVGDLNGFVQTVITAGVSGPSPPAWNRTPGGDTTDGAVIWMDGGDADWQANFNYVANQPIIDSNDHVQLALNAGQSGSTVPVWSTTGGTVQDGLYPIFPAPGVAPWQVVLGVAEQNITGSSWYGYVIQALDSSGSPLAVSLFGYTNQASNILSRNVYIAITWTAVTGAHAYNVYRVQGGETGFIANTSNIWFNDTGFEPPGGGTTFPYPSVMWQDQGPALDWFANFFYNAGDSIKDPAGHFQIVQNSGTSGTTEPVWNDSGGTVSDGGVVWQNTGNASAPQQPITAEFNFYFRVRFEEDTQDFEKWAQGLWTIGGSSSNKGDGQIKLMSSRALLGTIPLAPPVSPPPPVTGSDVLAWIDLNSATNDTSWIYMSTSSDGGMTWTTPVKVLDLDANPAPPVSGVDTVDALSISLGEMPDGSVGLIYCTWCDYFAPVATAPAYNPGLPMDASNMAGALAGQLNDVTRNYGPISYGGALWSFPETTNAYLYSGSGASADGVITFIYKSTDGGATWAIQDLAHAPEQYLPSCMIWDGSSPSVTIAPINPTLPATGGPHPQTKTAVSLIDFSMNTGLFGTAYAVTDLYNAPAGATSGVPESFPRHTYLFRLSTGLIRMVYEYFWKDTFSVIGGVNSPVQSQIYFQDWNGSSWSARTILPNQTVNWQYTYSLDSVIQDGDILNVVYSLSGAPSWSSQSNYVRINADGSFSTVVNLNPALSADGEVDWFMNTGTISGSNLLIPCAKNTLRTIGVLVGTPKNAPAFTYYSAGTTNTILDEAKVIHLN